MNETRNLVIGRLIELPTEIEREERAVLDLATARQRAEIHLDEMKAARLLERNSEGFPLIDGKNAEQREAQLLAVTTDERRACARAAESERAAAVRLHRKQNELAALRAASRVLGLED